MLVTRLDLADLRRFQRESISPSPGMNLLVGPNGAGKTSVIEALHVMAYGRSFRGRIGDGLVRQGADALEIFVEWQAGHPQTSHRAGLRHTGSAWTGRLDGADVTHLGELCASLTVVTVEPGSHQLITGAGEGRRRFVDWGLFHVEPTFLPVWRRYARALKQRNALLKSRATSMELEPWEREMAAAGEPLTQHRGRYLEEMQPHLQEQLDALLPAAGAGCIQFQPGWRREDLGLGDALLLSRERDLAAGFTSVGPHRADWRIDLTLIPGRSALSRGQAKLTALSMLLAQAEHQARFRAEWPVIALDDLTSELDREHQRRVLDRIRASGAQIFISGTELPAILEPGEATGLFHVEHGHVYPFSQG